MPLLPPQEAPSRSLQSQQLQNQISTHPPTTEHAYHSSRRKQSIKQVWLWWMKGVLEDLKKPSYRIWPFFQTSPEVAKLGNSHSLNDPKGARVLLWGGHNQCLQDVWVTDTYFINNLTYTKCPRESLTGWLLTAPDNSRGNWSHAGSAASTHSTEAMVPFLPQRCDTNKYNYLQNLKCKDNTVKSFPPSAVTCGKQIGK